MISIQDTSELKHKCGIYMILCSANGKIYIGSSTDLRARFYSHRHRLNNNKHKAEHLQNAYNLYGADTFTFVVLEHCPVEDIVNYEQKFIDEFKPYKREIGFNTRKVAEVNLGCKRTEEQKDHMRWLAKNRPPASQITRDRIREMWVKKWDSRTARSIRETGKTFTIVSPTGETFTSCGIRDFARKNNLCVTTLRKVIQGRLLTVSGWHLLGTQPHAPYKFLDYYGKLHEIPHGGLTEFCNKNKLTTHYMSMVWTGNRKHHKGWTRYDDKSLFVTFVSPGNEVIEVSRPALPVFAKERGLESLYFGLLIGNKMKSYRGWRLQSNATQPDYKFINPDGQPTDIPWGELEDFAKKINVNTGIIKRVWAGYKRDFNGWVRYDRPFKNVTLLSPSSVSVEIKEGKVLAFTKEHGLNISQMCRLIKGEIDIYKGWKLAQPVAA